MIATFHAHHDCSCSLWAPRACGFRPSSIDDDTSQRFHSQDTVNFVPQLIPSPSPCVQLEALKLSIPQVRNLLRQLFYRTFRRLRRRRKWSSSLGPSEVIAGPSLSIRKKWFTA